MIANAMGTPYSYFLAGPLNIGLIALVLASVAYSYLSNRREADTGARGAATVIQHRLSSLSIFALAAVCAG